MGPTMLGPRSARSTAIGVTVLLASWACRPASPPSSSTVRDSAGVTIVENQAPVDAAGTSIVLDSVPLVDFTGGGDGGDFGSRLGVTRMRDGRILAREGERIRWFERDGRWIRTTGRQGSGPGEFRQIDLVAPFGDSILIFDYGLLRITVLDSAGRIGRSSSIYAADSLGDGFPLAALADGRMVMGRFRPSSVLGMRRDSITIALASNDGNAGPRVGRFPWMDQVNFATENGIGMRRIAFARTSYWAALDTMVLIATNERFQFDWYRQDGSLARSVRRSWTPKAITEADISEWIEDRLATFSARDENRKPVFREIFSKPPWPKEKPPYDGLLVAETGEVWAMEYAEPGQRHKPSTYSVFDREGRWTTRVTVPVGVTPVAINDAEMTAIGLDDDDVPHVRIYRLRRR